MHTTLPTSLRLVARRPARTAGFTLIEMLISITIGLGILAGLVGVLASNASSSRTNDRTSELLTNGRYALNAMKHDLREAGFRGYTWAEPDAPAGMGTPGNECLQTGALAGTFVSNIRQGVWGFNGVNADNPFADTCIPAARYAAGNDVLAVRSLAPFPSAALVADTVYFQSTYERGQAFRGTAAPVFGGTPAPLASFAMRAFVYYISPVTNVAAPETPAVPSLRRVALGANGAMVDELVASGIEHLQVQFGLLETDGTTRYMDAGVAPLDANASVATVSGWENVHSVRIWLLARSTSAEPGYSNTNTYTMAGQDFVKADGFRRQVFSTVAQLRN